MFHESKTPTIYGPLTSQILKALTTLPTAALLVPCSLKLFNNNIQISRHTQLTDLIEPTWAGYAPITLAFDGKVLALDDNNLGISAEGTFQCSTAPTPTDVIYGYFITGGTPTTLFVAERFASPENITEVDDFVGVQFVFPEPYTRSFSGT
jgi:hypothetical protein